MLQKLLNEERVSTQLTQEFSFARRFNGYDFLSLLFYMGLLTIQQADLSALLLKIPNEVIRELYYKYFLEQIQIQANLEINSPDVSNCVLELAKNNDPQPLVALLEQTLKELSNRDWPGFDEKHLKAILVAYFYSVGIYHIQSEPEVNQQYPDLLLRRRPPYKPPYQFIFELKFLYKKDAHRLEEVRAAVCQQLKGYLQADSFRELEDLRAWLLVFVGTEAKVVEEVK